jgi:hypothetical protein
MKGSEGNNMKVSALWMVVAALSAVALFGGVIAAPAPARADGPCLFQGDWNCYGPPQWNGQLQPTWEVPPYTWPNNRLQCNPSAYACYPVVRP